MSNVSQGTIDSDVHNEVHNEQALLPYLADYWIEHITNTLFKGPTDTYYPPKSPVAARPDIRPDDGSPPGSSLALLQEHVLGSTGEVDYAVLNCLYAIDSLHNPDAAGALASAVNDWQNPQWVHNEPRLPAPLPPPHPPPPPPPPTT